MITHVLAMATVVVALATGPLSAQALLDPVQIADSIGNEIERAVITRDLPRLEAARVLAERATTAFPENGLLRHYLGTALYRQSTMDEDGDVVAAAKRAQEVLEQAADLDPRPETYAMLSAVLGQQIGANPLKGMLLGPKVGSTIGTAIELGPTNPRVWMLHGTGALYTPSLFGGGTDKAIQRLTQALGFFETDSAQSPDPTWGHAECWAWLGIAKERSEDIAGAEEAFLQALSLEPDFVWVSDVLLPGLSTEGTDPG